MDKRDWEGVEEFIKEEKSETEHKADAASRNDNEFYVSTSRYNDLVNSKKWQPVGKPSGGKVKVKVRSKDGTMEEHTVYLDSAADALDSIGKRLDAAIDAAHALGQRLDAMGKGAFNPSAYGKKMAEMGVSIKELRQSCRDKDLTPAEKEKVISAWEKAKG